MRTLSAMLLCMFFTALPLPAQVPGDTLAPQSSASGWLAIETDQPGAVVLLDGDSVGTTPLRLSFSQAARRHLRLVPREVSNWLCDPIVDTLDIEPAATRTLRYRFQQKLLVVSTPAEAAVFVEDSLIGTTPLVVQLPSGPLRLRKMGYADTTLDLSAATRGILAPSLKKVWKSSGEESVFMEPEERGLHLRLYLTGATTVIAGAISAYFKVKADNTYSQYVRTGDPNQLSDVNRLDTAAGIALAAAQVSFGLFTYFLLSE